MKSIDVKSLLIGILGTALVMVLMGQSSMRKQYDVECLHLESSHETLNIVCHKFDLSEHLMLSVSEEARAYNLSQFRGM